MKLFKNIYNPFKPHIAQLQNEKFSVRKLSAYGWAYLDSSTSKIDADRWWTDEDNILRYTVFTTKEMAVDRLEQYKKFKKAKFSKRVV
jgi:hypothetical protein